MSGLEGTQWRRLLPAIKVSQSVQRGEWEGGRGACKDEDQFRIMTRTRQLWPALHQVELNTIICTERDQLQLSSGEEEREEGGWSGSRPR